MTLWDCTPLFPVPFVCVCVLKSVKVWFTLEITAKDKVGQETNYSTLGIFFPRFGINDTYYRKCGLNGMGNMPRTLHTLFQLILRKLLYLTPKIL